MSPYEKCRERKSGSLIHNKDTYPETQQEGPAAWLTSPYLVAFTSRMLNDTSHKDYVQSPDCPVLPAQAFSPERNAPSRQEVERQHDLIASQTQEAGFVNAYGAFAFPYTPGAEDRTPELQSAVTPFMHDMIVTSL